MGKRQIGQMQPFEFVLTLIIADLATIPMAETGIPLFYGIIPLLTLVLIHYVITTLSRTSKKASKLFSGSPMLIMHNQQVDYSLLKSLNMSIEDLAELLRGCGYFHFKEVEYAILETNGSLSVMPNSQYAPARRLDLNLPEERDKFQDFLIADGKFVQENLEEHKLTQGFLINMLKQKKINQINNIVFLSRNNSEEFCYQLVGGSIQTIKTGTKEKS